MPCVLSTRAGQAQDTGTLADPHELVSIRGSPLNTNSPTDPSSRVTSLLREFSSGSKCPVRVISYNPVE